MDMSRQKIGIKEETSNKGKKAHGLQGAALNFFLFSTLHLRAAPSLFSGIPKFRWIIVFHMLCVEKYGFVAHDSSMFPAVFQTWWIERVSVGELAGWTHVVSSSIGQSQGLG